MHECVEFSVILFVYASCSFVHMCKTLKGMMCGVMRWILAYT